MHPDRIAALLQPFLAGPSPSAAAKDLSFRAGFGPGESAVLSETQLQDISTYIDLLLRWNARINLTSVRQPEEIVTRHFGESLFAARCLFPGAARSSQGEGATDQRPTTNDHLIDVGSGAGFPGLPIKIWNPTLPLTLIESNQKKATFLREVIRALTLMDVDVFSARAETYPPQHAALVTLRAVGRFETAVLAASRLLAPAGRLALLIGESQLSRVRELLPNLLWLEPLPVPLSLRRMLAIGSRADFVGIQTNLDTSQIS